MKAQLDEGGGRTLLGDNKAAWPCRGPSGSNVLEFGFHLNSDIYMYNGSYVHSVLTREKFDLRRVFWNVTTSQLCYKFLNWT